MRTFCSIKVVHIVVKVRVRVRIGLYVWMENEWKSMQVLTIKGRQTFLCACERERESDGMIDRDCDQAQ